MAVRLDKPWQPLAAETVAALPGQLGVFELAREDGEVVYIGYAGGRSTHGLRSAVGQHLGAPPGGASRFRVEINTAYRTRHLELLQVFVADHGRLPAGNDEVEASSLGRMRP